MLFLIENCKSLSFILGHRRSHSLATTIGEELTRLCTSAFSHTIIATGTTVAPPSDNVGINVNNRFKGCRWYRLFTGQCTPRQPQTTADYFKLPQGTADYCRPRKTTENYYILTYTNATADNSRLPQTAVEYCRLTRTTVVHRRLQQTTAYCRKLPIPHTTANYRYRRLPCRLLWPFR